MIRYKGASYDKSRRKFRGLITYKGHRTFMLDSIEPITPHILYNFSNEEMIRVGGVKRHNNPNKNSYREYQKEYRKKHREWLNFRASMRQKIRRMELLQEIGTSCIFCGAEPVHLHHTVEMYHNCSIRHYIDYKDILIPLCSSCHRVWHTLKDYLDIIVM